MGTFINPSSFWLLQQFIAVAINFFSSMLGKKCRGKTVAWAFTTLNQLLLLPHARLVKYTGSKALWQRFQIAQPRSKLGINACPKTSRVGARSTVPAGMTTCVYFHTALCEYSLPLDLVLAHFPPLSVPLSTAAAHRLHVVPHAFHFFPPEL